jgi:hypothetical protein
MLNGRILKAMKKNLGKGDVEYVEVGTIKI